MPKKANEPRRGFETTEFIVAGLLILASAVMVLTTRLDAADWIEYSKWVGGAFVLSRGLAKLNNGNTD